MKYTFYLLGIGRYVSLLDDLILSIETYCPRGIDFNCVVFTDCSNYHKKEKVNVVNVQDYGWPGNTLYRYKLIKDNLNHASDYHFFLNANLEFRTNKFFEYEFGNGAVFVQHPGYVGKRFFVPRNFEYRDNITCSVRRSWLFGTYVQGTLWGGHYSIFANMCELLSKMVDVDCDRGLMAKVHDESYLNWFYHKHKSNCVLLDASYTWPQEWKTKHKVNIASRDKRVILGADFLKALKS